MRRVLILFFLLPVALFAANDDAEKLLDKAVAKLKSDSGVQMQFEYSVYDADASLQYSEKGILLIDADKVAKGKECFALLLEELKIWCDGTVQWNFSGQTNEIYITDASSPEAQNLSPLYIMEMYRAGYSAVMDSVNGRTEVTLETSSPDNNINKVKLLFAASTLRLESMFIYMAGQGYIEVALDAYTAHCTFPAGVYECPLKDYPTAEVVDMR